MTLAEGPFDLIFGVPLHPLVVHAAVVFVPTAALGLVVMACWPRFSADFGWVVSGVAAAASLSCFVAREAGEALAARIGQPGFGHADLGQRMPLLSAGLVVLSVSLWLIDRAARGQRGRPRARLAVAGLALLVAAANVFLVVRVGHTGAQSVWGGVAATSGQG